MMVFVVVVGVKERLTSTGILNHSNDNYFTLQDLSSFHQLRYSKMHSGLIIDVISVKEIEHK